MVYVFLLMGVMLLFLGGEWLVRGAVALAKRLGLSELIIGLVLVGFGTSTPELLVSVMAAFEGQPDIAVGNVVGSNIANILLILGGAALITPLTCTPALVFRDGSVMVGASLLLIAFAALGTWSWPVGLTFLFGFVGYVALTYWSESRWQALSAQLRQEEAQLLQPRQIPFISGILMVGFGLGLLMLGANLLVNNAVLLARSWGISERVIGLTLVAVGTSLPELATSLIAAWRGKADVAVGNVVGSNIFNILGILGIAAVIQPLSINPALLAFDLWVMLAVAIGLLPFLITGWRLNRIEGAMFLALYTVYLITLGPMH